MKWFISLIALTIFVLFILGSIDSPTKGDGSYPITLETQLDPTEWWPNTDRIYLEYLA